MTGPEVTQPDPDGGVEMTDAEWAAFRGVEVTAAMKAEDVDEFARILRGTPADIWASVDDTTRGRWHDEARRVLAAGLPKFQRRAWLEGARAVDAAYIDPSVFEEICPYGERSPS